MFGLVSSDEERQFSFTNPNYGKGEQRPLNKQKDELLQKSILQSKKHPRFIARNLPFHQSLSEVGVTNKEKGGTPLFPRQLKYMLNHNWFHIMLRWHSLFSLLGLLFLWFLFLVIFAFIYVYVDAAVPNIDCGLGKSGDPIQFTSALAFSLETCTTVGYSTPNNSNGFFEADCKSLQFAVYLQMTWSMIFNAFFTAFIWARLARCEQRGAQLLFSNKAIIERKAGKWLFHTRIYDVDSQLPIVEAHVRMYCVSWSKYDERQQGQPRFLYAMRIFDPNDEINAALFTSAPTIATHHIDAYSPLTPTQYRRDMHMMKGHGLMLREVDQLAGNTGAYACPVCGDTYETYENLKRHIEFNKVLEDSDPNVPIKGTHRDMDLIGPVLVESPELTKAEIIENLKDKEIICVVEGIEPMVSGTFSCLHSYRLEDIEFERRFENCVTKDAKRIYVDLDKFHETVEVDPNTVSIEMYNSFGETS